MTILSLVVTSGTFLTLFLHRMSHTFQENYRKRKFSWNCEKVVVVTTATPSGCDLDICFNDHVFCFPEAKELALEGFGECWGVNQSSLKPAQLAPFLIHVTWKRRSLEIMGRGAARILWGIHKFALTFFWFLHILPRFICFVILFVCLFVRWSINCTQSLTNYCGFFHSTQKKN